MISLGSVLHNPTQSVLPSKLRILQILIYLVLRHFSRVLGAYLPFLIESPPLLHRIPLFPDARELFQGCQGIIPRMPGNRPILILRTLGRGIPYLNPKEGWLQTTKLDFSLQLNGKCI
jgi:hypothetical protein